MAERSRSRWDPRPAGAADGGKRKHDDSFGNKDRGGGNSDRSRGYSKRERTPDDSSGPYPSRGRGYQVDTSRRSKWSGSADFTKWRCEECKSENVDLGGNSFCSYCGTARSSRDEDPRYGRPRSFTGGDRGGRNRDCRDSERYDYYRPSRPRSGDDRRSRDEDDRKDTRDASGRRSEGMPRKISRGGRDEDIKARPPVKSEWPPPFDSAGAAYVFDARSGMFYEAVSDFFYDAASKLYYSNKRASYFLHCPGEDPPFRPVQQQTQAGNGQQSAVLADPQARASGTANGAASAADSKAPSNAGASSSKAAGAEKKKIAISIGKKSKRKSDAGFSNPPSHAPVIEAGTIGKKVEQVSTNEGSDLSASTAAAGHDSQTVTPATHKRHVADIDKWSERGKEGRSGKDDPEVSSTAPPQAAASHAGKVPATAAGKPVCLLCKRKFASLEKLREHEEKSALHKQNLLKAAAAAESSPQKPAAGAAEYRDRAKERRFMFGSEPKKTPGLERGRNTAGASIMTTGRPVSTTEAIAPEQNLGDGTVGNKLLQKMGWKKGGSLGRKVDETAAQGSLSSQCPGVNEQLKQDWERIEGLAQSSNGVGRGQPSGRGRGIGS